MATDSPQAARTQAIRGVLDRQAKVVWANRLDSRMGALKVNAQAVADGAGTTYQTIWKITKGELYPKEYLRIAISLALGAEVEEIFPMPTRAEIVAAVSTTTPEAVAS